MSERIPACLSLGGKISAGRARRLCRAIQREGLALDWGDAQFEPTSAEDLLDACQDRDGTPVLWLCDDQARCGRFPNLEAFLVQHQLAFDLQADGKFEFDAQRISFRPGLGSGAILTNSGGDAVVSADSVEPTVALLQAAIKSGQAANLAACLSQVEAALAALRDALPPIYPPLPAFDIV